MTEELALTMDEIVENCETVEDLIKLNEKMRENGSKSVIELLEERG